MSAVRAEDHAPRLGVHVTDRCQLDCQHCLRDPEQKPRDLPLELFERVLDQACRVHGLRRISLTGGEPLLHPRFDELVDAIAARGCSVDWVSNGRLVPQLLERWDSTPARVAAVRSVTLSLDAATPELHDSLREPGSHRDVMRAAVACAGRALPFGVQMAVHARNEHELEQVGLLAASLGAKHVSFSLTQPTGTAHDAALYVPPARLRALRARVETLGRALSVAIVLPEGHHDPARFTTCAPLRGETLHVDVGGRLSLCCLHAQVPGAEPDSDVIADLREVSLAEAHARFLARGAELQRRRLERLTTTPDSEWDHFGCNACLASFGRPHWVDGGAAGAAARRQRWQGAWAPSPERHAPPVVRRLPVAP